MPDSLQNYSPVVQIQVNNRDQSAFFAPWLESITFEEHLEGQADGLEIVLEDSTGRFLRDWYPVQGATVEARLGYTGGQMLNTMACNVDEIQIDGPDSKVTIRALGAANTHPVRTKRSRAFTNTTLQALAQQVASENGLTIIGDVPDITWARVTQFKETDLAFLHRIGKENLLTFNVHGKNLAFYDTGALEAQSSVLLANMRDLTRWTFREKVIHGSVQASYLNRDTKQNDTATLTIPEHAHPNVKKVKRRTENKTHTARLAKAALHDTKAWERDGTLTLPGDPRLRAGSNLELSADFGVLAGLWQIRQTRHRIQRDQGYETELEVRHIAK